MKPENESKIKESIKTLTKNTQQYEELLQTYINSQSVSAYLLPQTGTKNRIKTAIDNAKNHLLLHRKNDSFWDGKVEDTPALTAQYILYMHYMDVVDLEKQKKCINYLLNIQNENGSWRIYAGDEGILSYTIHCYFGLKVAGVDINHPKMIKAREYILANGGLDKGNVETRFLLALFGKSSWKRVVPIPLQILMLGKWFPLSMWNMAYWIRVTLVSMGILYLLKPVKDIGTETDIDELWINPKIKNKYTCPREIKYFSLENVIYIGSIFIKVFLKVVPKKRILQRALKWTLDHQDESGDWGGIYPPIMYGSFMLKEMGFSNDSSSVKRAKEAIERLQWVTDDEIMQMSCSSPIWDTGWATIALIRAGVNPQDDIIQKSKDWLYFKQIWKEGDWIVHAPDAKPGM